jgi:hypothetical protein
VLPDHGSTEHPTLPASWQLERCCSPASHNTPTTSTARTTTIAVRMVRSSPHRRTTQALGTRPADLRSTLPAHDDQPRAGPGADRRAAAELGDRHRRRGRLQKAKKGSKKGSKKAKQRPVLVIRGIPKPIDDQRGNWVIVPDDGGTFRVARVAGPPPVINIKPPVVRVEPVPVRMVGIDWPGILALVVALATWTGVEPSDLLRALFRL